MRTDASFTAFYQGVLKASDGLTDEPVLPRYRKTPRRINEGALPHRYTSPEDRYRHAYFEALEQACGEIERRFDQSDLPLICDIESLLVNAANGETVTEISEDITKCFQGRIDVSRLQIQLSMLPNAINTAFATSVKMKKVTSVRTIADTLNQNNLVKGMLGEVDKLLRIYLTFPITSATAERSFSSLRLIKTYLRSTMTSQRLNNLFLLYVHKHLTDALDLISVAKEFVSANIRRQNYFGKF